jgi:uncharacterized protein (DUF1684 family)
MNVASWAISILVAALLVGACNAGAPAPADEGDYVSRIEAERTAKDEAFRSQPNEPVPPGRVAELVPLKYFAPDPEFAVPASLKLSAERIVVDMPTSTGETRKEERVGVLEFTLKGQLMTLSAFIEAGSNDVSRLFVPFSDLTSGNETYYAGRYLDLERTPTGLYNVDFNKAYHPYCYYNAKYDCPYPPRENRLPLPVRAGERLPASKPAAPAGNEPP